MSKESFHPYKLPLEAGGERLGVLVRHVGSDGSTGWGDAAPLPGWSIETCDDVMRGLDVPSLRCGREAASIALAGYASWPLIHERLPLNALLEGTSMAMIEQAKRAALGGCHCFKIKTAGVPLDRLPGFLSEILAVCEPGSRFRLDPNRAWGFEEALSILNAVRDFPVEYIEEPLSDASLLCDFLKFSPLPIALDETLRELDPEDLVRFRGAAALVLKPTLMGSFQRAAAFAAAGAPLGMTSVVSSCFESGVGIYTLGRFAASLPMLAAAGLDPYTRLSGDVLSQRLKFPEFHFDPTQPMPPVSEHACIL